MTSNVDFIFIGHRAARAGVTEEELRKMIDEIRLACREVDGKIQIKGTDAG